MSSDARKVLLAEKWVESEVDPTGWWISEKLDGVRAYWDGKNFYSRQGNLFVAPSWFKEDLPKSPLDGELWCGRGLFQKCVGIVKKQKDAVEDDWKFVTYLVFDAPKQEGTYEERVAYLQKTVRSDRSTSYASVVGIKKCEGKEHLKKALAEVEKHGGEGLMLRKPKSTYANGRSDTLLKVKTFHDEEALVTGYKKGEGRCYGMMGGLICELPNKKQFNIGTGFTDAQRQKPPKKGHVVTFKYQELTNDGIPRFPVFVRERNDITWEDILENAKTNPPKSSLGKVIPVLKKQHSIMFSVIPSRNTETGEKLVTSDDEMDEEEEVKKTDNSKKEKPICKYGNQCFRSNAKHLNAFSHPNRPQAEEEPAKEAEEPKKRPCKFAGACYLKSSMHLKLFSHDDVAVKEVEVVEEVIERDEYEEIIENDEVITVRKEEWESLHAQLGAQSMRIKELEAQLGLIKEAKELEETDEPSPKKRKLVEAAAKAQEV